MTKLYCKACGAWGATGHIKGCECLGDEAQGLKPPPLFELRRMREEAKEMKRLFYAINNGTPEERATAEAKLKGFDVVA